MFRLCLLWPSAKNRPDMDTGFADVNLRPHSVEELTLFEIVISGESEENDDQRIQCH